jgi:hypothetical protein
MYPYSVCITQNQHERFFGAPYRKPRKIGCGVFACTYGSKDPNKVIKITSDPTDVAALQVANNFHVEGVPKLYETMRLASRIEWRRGGYAGGRMRPPPPIYGMVVERLKPFGTQAQEKYEGTVACIRHEAEGGGGSEGAREICCDPGRIRTDMKAKCRQIARDLPPAMEELYDAGLNVRDIHVGNIGQAKDGRWKILDLGLSDAEFATEPKALEGARRATAARRRRRRRRLR